MLSKQKKICSNTKTIKGCGEEKQISDFKIIRTNKTTGKAYRERICTECKNRSRRKTKTAEPKDEAHIHRVLNGLWR